jgi:hypothetical protein
MRALVLTAFTVLATGCSTGAGDDPGIGVGAGGGGSAGGGSVMPGTDTPASLDFQDPGLFAARDQYVVTVRALPPRVYHVQFALPSGSGDPLDAVLDRNETETDADGYATVQVTAPSSPTSFELRATVGSRSASQTLTVADGGAATVQVEPRRLNLSALRDITTWIASAYVNKTCAELPGIPPEDGPIVAPVAGKGDAPIIPQVPARTRLAITLRSGHFIGGCTTVESLPPGPLSSPQVVVVSLLNRPIDLSASRLNISLGVGDAAEAWSAPLSAAAASVQLGVLGTSADDVDALLDAMREASGDSRQQFENARQAELWDDLLRARWGQSAATKLRDLVGTWLAAGRQRFASATPTFVGSLSPLAQGAEDQDSSAKLQLSSVAGLPAASAGFADSAQVAWSASADDTVALGTDLYFVRSRLAATLAEAAALDDFAGAEDAPAALAAALDCSAFGAALAQAGSDNQLAYGSCDGECLAALCQNGLGALWHRGEDTEGLTPTRLSLTATGKAYVGDAAEVAGLTGSWIGKLDGDGTDIATGGELAASAPSNTK